MIVPNTLYFKRSQKMFNTSASTSKEGDSFANKWHHELLFPESGDVMDFTTPIITPESSPRVSSLLASPNLKKELVKGGSEKQNTDADMEEKPLLNEAYHTYVGTLFAKKYQALSKEFEQELQIVMDNLQNTLNEVSSGKRLSVPKPKRDIISTETRKYLKKWLRDHKSNPYPTEEQKQELVKKTGLTLQQINNWVSNHHKVFI